MTNGTKASSKEASVRWYKDLVPKLRLLSSVCGLRGTQPTVFVVMAVVWAVAGR